jgi:uncharacterized protein YcbK (DUF882 family)
MLPASLFGVTRTRSHATRTKSHLRLTRAGRARLRLARLRALILSSPVHGTRESLLHQNEMINEEQLERIQNDDELHQLILAQSLVRIPEDNKVDVASNLPEDRRYCRPWTRDFVVDFAQERWEKFHKPTVVTSAVRTVEFQHKLIRYNHNAAAEAGETASPHLSGATIDIAKRGMSRKEIQWARDYLLALQNQGFLDVEEEFRQSVFHISVYRRYDTLGADEPAVATTTTTPIADPAVMEMLPQSPVIPDPPKP